MNNHQERKHILYFSLAWLFVQLLLLWKNGIVADGESIKYIDQAQKFLQTGEFSSNNFILYSIQIFLLAGVIKINAGFWLVILIQFIFSWLATVSLYKLSVYLFDHLTACVTVTLFLLNFPLQEFNTFLQTESLFYSFTVIISSYILRLQEFKLKHFLLILFLAGLISITRPTGLLFIPVIYIYIFIRHFNLATVVQKTTMLVGFCIVFLFLLNKALGTGGELDFILPFVTENIICGVPAFAETKQVDHAGYGNSIYGLLSYILHHFPQFTKLCWLRSLAFWGLIRNYYSLSHNIYLALFFYTLYILNIYQLVSGNKKIKQALFYCGSLIFFTWFTVMLTCDDWHNRFFLTITPYLILFAAPFLAKLIRKYSNTN